MNQIIVNTLSKLILGELQQFENMQVFPLTLETDKDFPYLTLKEALEKEVLTVSEVSSGGSVPTLKVINKGDMPVILLDGEELSGAKQNRTLNTTILLKEKSETEIPVSCTEQGRWSYTSKEFSDSDVIMSQKIREVKVSSVAESLKEGRGFMSNQSEVWDRIEILSDEAKISSPTGAMKDVFISKEKDLEEYLNEFSCQAAQKGIVVLINGKMAGVDYISYAPAFEILFNKLIKSYAIDALLDNKKKTADDPLKIAHNFLEDATKCQENAFKSVGYGWDHRLESDKIVGSALVHEDLVIHTALFKRRKTTKDDNFSNLRERRRFRERTNIIYD